MKQAYSEIMFHPTRGIWLAITLRRNEYSSTLPEILWSYFLEDEE